MASEEQQKIPTDKEAEREFEEAEKAFEEKNKTIAAQQSGEPTKEETAKKYQDILMALGFIRYDNKEKGIAYKLHAGPLQIGRTFTDKTPTGNMWVRCLVDGEHGKKDEFMKREIIKEVPQVALFYCIRNGELPMPSSDVVGKVVGKSEKAIQIQFKEFDQIRTEWWGFGALKKNNEGGNYIPGSYSKQTEKYDAKMQVPRDILLINYDTELEKAPITVSGDGHSHTVEYATEKVKSSPLADVIVHKEPVTLTEGERSTVDYYVNLIGEITEKVSADGRIAKNERGYAINMVFGAITKDTRAALIAALKNGGEGQ